MKKINIIKVLKMNGEWTKYRITPCNAFDKIKHKDVAKQFSSLNDIIDHFQLQDVRELGTRYSYDLKGQKYGIESYEAYLNE